MAELNQVATAVMIEDESWRRSSLEVLIGNILHPFLSLVAIGICILPKYGIIPAWVVFLINFYLAIQIPSFAHELTHEPDSKTNWNWLLRLNLHLTSPFVLGFSEYRKLHFLHHLNTNTDKDPDYSLIKGRRFSSFIGLVFVQECWFFYAVSHRQMQPGFTPLYIIRLFVFFAYIYTIGWSNYLLLFFLPSKLSSGLSFLVFSHEAHTHESGLIKGSYNLKPRYFKLHKFLKLLIGFYAYNIAYYHGTHHAYPWVSPIKIKLFTEKLQQEGIELPSRLFIY